MHDTALRILCISQSDKAKDSSFFQQRILGLSIPEHTLENIVLGVFGPTEGLLYVYKAQPATHKFKSGLKVMLRS